MIHRSANRSPVRVSRWGSASVLAAALGVVALGCPVEPDAAPPEPPAVAEVNGEAVTADWLGHELTRFRRQHGQLAFRSESDLEQVRRVLLEDRIKDLLLLQAGRRRGLEATPEEIHRALLRKRADYPGRTFEEHLADSGILLSDLKRELAERIVIQKLVDREVAARVAVTEDEIAARYEADAKAFAQAEQVHALQIVVKTEEEARRIHDELKRGGDFAELARRHSISPEATEGGDLGWFARGVMPIVFDETCFDLHPNRISEVVESQYGYHIFKVVERRKAADSRPLAEAAPQLERELRIEKAQALHDSFLSDLRKKARIVIDDEVLATVR